MVKHQLPFGASFTHALVEKVIEMAGHCEQQCPDFVPAVIWCRSKRGEHFGLFAIERRYLAPESFFSLGGVQVHVAASDQSRSTGRTLDWTDGVGITDVTTSTI
jgi:hypothetical protein